MTGKRKTIKDHEVEFNRKHQKEREIQEKLEEEKMEIEAEDYVRGIDFTAHSQWDDHLKNHSNDLDDIVKKEHNIKEAKLKDENIRSRYSRNIEFKTTYLLVPLKGKNIIENIDSSEFSNLLYNIAKEIRLTRNFDLKKGTIKLDYLGVLSNSDYNKLVDITKKYDYVIGEVTKIKLNDKLEE